jgi:hypothetical protein
MGLLLVDAESSVLIRPTGNPQLMPTGVRPKLLMAKFGVLQRERGSIKDLLDNLI